MAFRSPTILIFSPTKLLVLEALEGDCYVADSSEGAGALRYPLFLETLLDLPLGDRGGEEILGRWTGNSPSVLAGECGRPAPAGPSVTGESLNELLGTPSGRFLTLPLALSS
jgi:hypothetical protein